MCRIHSDHRWSIFTLLGTCSACLLPALYTMSGGLHSTTQLGRTGAADTAGRGLSLRTTRSWSKEGACVPVPVLASTWEIWAHLAAGDPSRGSWSKASGGNIRVLKPPSRVSSPWLPLRLPLVNSMLLE